MAKEESKIIQGIEINFDHIKTMRDMMRLDKAEDIDALNMEMARGIKKWGRDDLDPQNPESYWDLAPHEWMEVKTRYKTELATLFFRNGRNSENSVS